MSKPVLFGSIERKKGVEMAYRRNNRGRRRRSSWNKRRRPMVARRRSVIGDRF